MTTQISGAISLVLKRKGNDVWAIAPEQTVYEAVERMAEKAVGALLVLSEGKIAGIISERDYARKVILRGKSSRTTLVREIMASPVISATPGQSVSECMAIMTRTRIRHLPIVEHGTILGVVSIGDIVKWIVSEQEGIIEQLHNYISASYPA
jgi:CBS domain-containing protein